MQHQAKDIAAVWGLPAPPPARAQQVLSHLVTDSRNIVFPATSLFFALAGPRRNGADFLGAAYQRGVRFFVVATLPAEAHALFPEAHFFLVPNVLAALQALAAWHRSFFTYPVVGITGSNGKTMVKEWLYQLLQPHYHIVRSPRSYNSQLGVPLSIWQMGPQHNLALIEAGISQSGEMAALQKMIQPGLGIFTGLGPAHAAGFTSAAEKLQEKLQLFTGAQQWVVAADDLPPLSPPEGTALFTWGRLPHNDLQLLRATPHAGGQTLALRYQDQEVEWWIPFADDISVRNALTCGLALLVMHRPMEEIKLGLRHLTALDMRMQLRKAIRQCFVLNDGYSNDWVALQEALKFLQAQAGSAKCTAILGDFPETPETGQNMYDLVFVLLQEKKMDRLIAIGPQWHAWLQQHAPQGLAHLSFLNKEQFFQAMRHTDFNQEFILVKGPRALGMEAIARWLEEQAHQTVLEINLSALTRNLQHYQSALPPACQLMVMVKAQGYGSGAAEIALRLEQSGVHYLAVAYADEGVALRQAGISLPILVMSPDPLAFEALLEHRLEPEIFSWEILHAFAAFLQAQGISHFPIHLKVNTGMNRLGFEPSDALALVDFFKDNNSMAIRSVFSHLAASENPAQDAFTQAQLTALSAFADPLAAALPYSFLRHIANTAAISRHPAARLDMVRLGIGLYGIDPSPASKAGETVASLKTTIAQVRSLPAGATVGYGRAGVLTRPSRIATVRLGYADGYSRVFGLGKGAMWLHGRLAPVVGQVCMDMTMLDVTDIPLAAAGDQVEVFGQHLPLTQLAQWAGTIPYEIMTGISQRVKRVYVEE